jgi:hypothetical protein
MGRLWVWIGDSEAKGQLHLRRSRSPNDLFKRQTSDVGFCRLGIDLNGANNTTGIQVNVAAIWLMENSSKFSKRLANHAKRTSAPGAGAGAHSVHA